MRNFLLKLFVFAGIHLGLLALVFALYLKRFPPSTSYYMASLDKHSLLLTQAPPRMIFIGGSSMAFGLDSGLVAKRSGYHPVNMGLLGAIGFEFMLREVAPFVQAGDVVVVAPEYLAFEIHYYAKPEFIARLIECRPSLIRVLSWKQNKELLDRGCVHHLGNMVRTMSGLPGRLLEANKGLYLRNGFDANGDHVTHHHLPSQRVAPLRFDFTASPTAQAAIDHLNRFHAECQRKGVRVFFSHPPYDRREFEKYRSSIQRLDARLKERLTIPMLDTSEELAYPSQLFFDTEYHLNLTGKVERSKFLAERVAAALQTPATKPTRQK